MIKDITNIQLLHGGNLYPEINAKYGVDSKSKPIYIAACNRRVVEFIQKLEEKMPKNKLLAELTKLLATENETLLDIRKAEYGEWFKNFLESHTTGSIYEEMGMWQAAKANVKEIFRSPFYPEYNNRGEFNPRNWRNSLYPTVHVIDPKHAFALYMLSLKEPEYVIVYKDNRERNADSSEDLRNVFRGN